MGGFAAIMLVSPSTGEDLSFDFGFRGAIVFPGVSNGQSFFLWNSNLGIVNIAEMLNGGGVFFDSVISVFTDNGSFQGEFASWLQSDGANHTIIPTPFQAYGIGQMNLVPASSTDTFDGLLAQYRFAPDGNEIEFAKFSPYIQSVSGTKYVNYCLLYTSPSPRDKRQSRMPSSA